MKLFKKTTMTLALSAAMLGGLAVSQQASALQDQASGVANINPNNIGQAVVFPYYTVRDGQKSFFNLTNVSGDTVAVKIRFHESLNSRDALDFIVVMSPYDVWSGWIEDGADAPVVRTTDKSCTVGAPNIGTTGQKLSSIAYDATDSTFEDQGTNSIERTREGYMVAQVMGVVASSVNSDGKTDGWNEKQPLAINGNTWTGSVAYNAEHVNGVPRNCTSVNSAFVANAPLSVNVTDPFFPDSDGMGDGDAKAILEFSGLVGAPQPNPLKGNFSIINADNGVGAGQSAVAIADFLTLATYATTGLEATDQNYITAQNFPYFLEPTLASGDNIWTVDGLEDVEAALTSVGLGNEWAENAATGARTDWVITFPTKAFHVDNKNAIGTSYVDPYVAPADALTNPLPNVQSAMSIYRVGSLALSGIIFEDNLDATGAAVEISIVGYDREELSAIADSGNTTPSPAPPTPVTKLFLQGEANVVTFGPDASSANGGNSALGAKNFVLNFDVVDTLGNDAPNGWASVDYTQGPAQLAAPQPGLPALGYMYKVRNQGDATLSFGQIAAHGWKNVAPTAPPPPTDDAVR